MKAVKRNNVWVGGQGRTPIIFGHGFGCDQSMWRLVAPAFLAGARVILFDQVGTGGSDSSQYDPLKYTSLQAYADDIIEVCEEMDVHDAVFVGHSVCAMIGMLAVIKAPRLFSRLVMVSPSPCYINRDGYHGGFEEDDIRLMLGYLNDNFEAWARTMGPAIMGNPDRPDLGLELAESFCRFHPVAAREFARLTFTSDNRADLGKVQVPTLIMQCSQDPIAPESVGQFVHENIRGSSLVKLKATGHCPNMSAPDETIAAIKAFLQAS